MTRGERPLVIGVTGTVVEDTIVTADGATTRDLGGIAYALATLSALLPEPAVIRPVLGVGEDAAESMRRFLAALPGINGEGVVPTPAVNNKVCIRYWAGDDRADGGRDETLRGGVPPLAWEALASWIGRLDAWLWNFISGMEVAQPTFMRLAAAFEGPILIDLHSLCLEHVHGGPRRHRRPARWEGWVEGTTWVQMNADEAGLLHADRPAPLAPEDEARLAARIHGLGAAGVLVTHGARGAVWYGADGVTSSASAAHTGRAVDPTGCGDVFGAAWLALHLGHGLPPDQALAGAVEAAGVAATIRGTRGLRAALLETVAAGSRPA